MRDYIIRRILLIIPTLFLASLTIFLVVRLIPGDIIDIMIIQIAQEGSVDDLDALRAVIKENLGLDVPVVTQFGRWIGVLPDADGRLGGILQGDLGDSLTRGLPVSELVLERLLTTVELGLLALIVAQIIALPVGILSALRQDTWLDYVARSFAILSIAVPGFWLGTMVMVFPSIWWGYTPPAVLIPFVEDPLGNLEMFIVPAIILGMVMSGTTTRMTRTVMLEVLRQDYIRTAWSKGLRERIVILRHGLKNALIPVITIIGLQAPVLIGGAVIIEKIFNLPGLGRLIVDSTLSRDYPVVSGTMLVFGAGTVLVNLVVDLVYGFLDPRIRYSR